MNNHFQQTERSAGCICAETEARTPSKECVEDVVRIRGKTDQEEKRWFSGDGTHDALQSTRVSHARGNRISE